MENNFSRNNRSLKEIIIDVLRLIVIATALAFLSSRFTLFYGVYAFVPAIFAYSAYRNSLLPTTLGAVIIYFPILFLLFNYNMDLVGFNFLIASTGIIIGDIHYSRRDIFSSILTGILFFTVSIAVFTYMKYDLLQLNSILQSDEAINLIVAQTKNFSGEVKITTDEIKNILLSAQPYLIIMISAQTVVFAYYTFAEFFSIKLDKSIGVWDFKLFSIPRLTLLTAFISILLMNILPFILDFNFTFIYLNLICIFSYALFIQGLAVAEFFILSKLGRFFKVVIMQLALFTFIIPLYPILSIVGLLDYLFNFRKLEY